MNQFHDSSPFAPKKVKKIPFITSYIISYGLSIQSFHRSAAHSSSGYLYPPTARNCIPDPGDAPYNKRKEAHHISIIMHYPASEEMQRELAKKVAAVHAQTVVEMLQSMSCPVEQKAAMIEAIREIHKKTDNV